MRGAALVLAAMLASGTPSYAQTSAVDALKPDPIALIIKIVPWLLKENEPYYFVTVRGYGRTTEEARTQALRAAVDQAVGSVINSEREVVDRRLRRSEVVQYAAGFVDKYEVKNIRYVDGLVEMTLDVYVKRSRLGDRLLGDHKTPGKIDNDRLRAQAETLDHSRKEGDRLLRMVLSDFPARAYEIEQNPARVYYDENRQKKLELNFTIRWRHAYAENLREALATVSQNPNAGHCLGSYATKCQYLGYVTIKARPGQNGWSRTAAFDDDVTMEMIRQNLIYSRPAVLFTFWDKQDQQIWRGCHRYADLENAFGGVLSNERLVQPTDQGLQINTYINWVGQAPFNLHNTNPPAIDRYDIAIVRGDQCPN